MDFDLTATSERSSPDVLHNRGVDGNRNFCSRFADLHQQKSKKVTS
jgi:hypothetical protein